MIVENIDRIYRSIAEICSRCGRNPEEIELVAISKTWGTDKIVEALKGGILHFGENYVQELESKRKLLVQHPIKWHFIGHLQTNKAKYIAKYIHLVHSVDNARIAEELQKRAMNAGREIDLLIEVHTTNEPSKSGVDPKEVVNLVKKIASLSHLRVRGLMTMGPFSEDPEDSRPSFRQLAGLKEMILREGIEQVTMQHLSMGMSHDYPIAIEEGATILRIGSAIFGERSKQNFEPITR